MTVMVPPSAPSDLYPSLLRFLQENGLNRTAKAFRKETEVEESGEADAPELLQLVQEWFAANVTVAKAEKKQKKTKKVEEEAKEEEEEEKDEKAEKKRKKKALADETINDEAEKEEVEEKVEKKLKKNKKVEDEAIKDASKKGEESEKKKRPAPEVTEVEEEEAAPAPKEKKQKQRPPAANEEVEEMPEEESGKKAGKKSKEKPKGDHFQREDWDKWSSQIKDVRLADNTHTAKKGDTWADKASEDLLKVRGKGFRKEMAKKKKASWRGGGMIDQGVNSVKFDSDSD